MPTINVSVYLTDEEMIDYLHNKDDINEYSREMIKKKIRTIK